MKMTDKIELTKDLTAEEINLRFELQAQRIALKELCDSFAKYGEQIDPRWLAIGRTELQKGLMSLERALNPPTYF